MSAEQAAVAALLNMGGSEPSASSSGGSIDSSSHPPPPRKRKGGSSSVSSSTRDRSRRRRSSALQKKKKYSVQVLLPPQGDIVSGETASHAHDDTASHSIPPEEEEEAVATAVERSSSSSSSSSLPQSTKGNNSSNNNSTSSTNNNNNGSGGASSTTSKKGRRSSSNKQAPVLHTFAVPPRIIQICKTPKTTVNHSYRDFSVVPPEPGYKHPTEDDLARLTFGETLHYILERPSLYGDCVAWLPHGRAFSILVPSRLEERKVLKRYFGHNRYSTFLSQLKNSGVKQLTNQSHQHGTARGTGNNNNATTNASSHANCFYHECLLRGLPHLCRYMPAVKDSRKLIADPKNEPNLETISLLWPVPAEAAERQSNNATDGNNNSIATVTKATASNSVQSPVVSVPRPPVVAPFVPSISMHQQMPQPQQQVTFQPTATQATFAKNPSQGQSGTNNLLASLLANAQGQQRTEAGMGDLNATLKSKLATLLSMSQQQQPRPVQPSQPNQLSLAPQQQPQHPAVTTQLLQPPKQQGSQYGSGAAFVPMRQSTVPQQQHVSAPKEPPLKAIATAIIKARLEEMVKQQKQSKQPKQQPGNASHENIESLLASILRKQGSSSSVSVAKPKVMRQEPLKQPPAPAALPKQISTESLMSAILENAMNQNAPRDNNPNPGPMQHNYSPSAVSSETTNSQAPSVENKAALVSRILQSQVGAILSNQTDGFAGSKSTAQETLSTLLQGSSSQQPPPPPKPQQGVPQWNSQSQPSMPASCPPPPLAPMDSSTQPNQLETLMSLLKPKQQQQLPPPPSQPSWPQANNVASSGPMSMHPVQQQQPQQQLPFQSTDYNDLLRKLQMAKGGGGGSTHAAPMAVAAAAPPPCDVGQKESGILTALAELLKRQGNNNNKI